MKLTPWIPYGRIIEHSIRLINIVCMFVSIFAYVQDLQLLLKKVQLETLEKTAY